MTELLDDNGVSITAFTGGDSEEPCGDTDGVEAKDDSSTIAAPGTIAALFPLVVNLFGGIAAALAGWVSQLCSGGDDNELLIALSLLF